MTEYDLSNLDNLKEQVKKFFDKKFPNETETILEEQREEYRNFLNKKNDLLSMIDDLQKDTPTIENTQTIKYDSKILTVDDNPNIQEGRQKIIEDFKSIIGESQENKKESDNKTIVEISMRVATSFKEGEEISEEEEKVYEQAREKVIEVIKDVSKDDKNWVKKCKEDANLKETFENKYLNNEYYKDPDESIRTTLIMDDDGNGTIIIYKNNEKQAHVKIPDFTPKKLDEIRKTNLTKYCTENNLEIELDQVTTRIDMTVGDLTNSQTQEQKPVEQEQPAEKTTEQGKVSDKTEQGGESLGKNETASLGALSGINTKEQPVSEQSKVEEKKQRPKAIIKEKGKKVNKEGKNLRKELLNGAKKLSDEMKKIVDSQPEDIRDEVERMSKEMKKPVDSQSDGIGSIATGNQWKKSVDSQSGGIGSIATEEQGNATEEQGNEITNPQDITGKKIVENMNQME